MNSKTSWQSIRESLDTVPVIDVHTHLGYGGRRNAANLAELAGYHWLHTELQRAGSPATMAEIRTDPAGYMTKAAPFFADIRNTSNHFCFVGMLRDLYGFRERTITPDNWAALDGRVREQAADPTWLNQVLERAHITRLPVANRPDEGMPDRSGRYWLYAYSEGLCMPVTKGGLQALAGEGQPLPAASDELSAVITGHVQHLAAEGVTTLHAWLRDTWAYGDYTAAGVDGALQTLAAGGAIAAPDRDRLISFCVDAVMAAAAEKRMTMQLFHGMWRYLPGDNPPRVGSFWNPEYVRALPRLADRHPGLNLDVFLSTRIPSHEMASMTRLCRNLYVSGGWWHGFTPSTLKSFFRDRLELLPHTAGNAFFSDGYMVEWIYAKLLLTRNCLAQALAELQDEGLLTAADVPAIAKRLLHDNALAIYRLE